MLGNQMYKFLILTDSASNPRSFPATMVTELEETYPYLLRAEFNDPVFYQLSFGNITTEQLLSQAISYLSHWHPDIIVVQSGMADCRPEAFTELEKSIITGIPMIGRVGRLRHLLHDPKIIKKRQKYRVTPNKFRKTLRKFKLIFSKSEILWIEIYTSISGGYEKSRPGVFKRIDTYNAIIKEIYGRNSISIQKALDDVNGVSTDHMHLNKSGHAAVANILIERIKLFLDTIDREDI